MTSWTSQSISILACKILRCSRCRILNIYLSIVPYPHWRTRRSGRFILVWLGVASYELRSRLNLLLTALSYCAVDWTYCAVRKWYIINDIKKRSNARKQMNCTCSRRSIVSYLHQEHIMGMWVMLNINGVVGWIAGLVVELGSPGKRSVGLVEKAVNDTVVPTYMSRYSRPFGRRPPHPLQLSSLCWSSIEYNVGVLRCDLSAGSWWWYAVVHLSFCPLSNCNQPTILFSLHLHCSRVQIDRLYKERASIATTNRSWCRSRTWI